MKDLLELQLGKEANWGVSAAGSARLMGVTDARLMPMVNGKVIEDLRAKLDPGHAAVLTGQAGAARVDGVLTYEDAPYLLDSLFDEETPTGANPYTYAYVSAQSYTPRKQTVYWGNTTGVYKLLGGVGSKLVIRGEASEQDTELTYSWELLGKSVASGALAVLSDRTVNPVMASQLTLYVDAWGGTLGTTEIQTSAFSFELSLDLNRILKRHLGSLAPDNFATRRATPGGNRLRLSLEFDATSKAYMDAIVGASAILQKQVRIKATDSPRSLQLDFAGTTVQAPEVFPDRDGIVSVDLEFEATYHSTMASWFAASIVNAVSALP